MTEEKNIPDSIWQLVLSDTDVSKQVRDVREQFVRVSGGTHQLEIKDAEQPAIVRVDGGKETELDIENADVHVQIRPDAEDVEIKKEGTGKLSINAESVHMGFVSVREGAFSAQLKGVTGAWISAESAFGSFDRAGQDDSLVIEGGGGIRADLEEGNDILVIDPQKDIGIQDSTASRIAEGPLKHFGVGLGNSGVVNAVLESLHKDSTGDHQERMDDLAKEHDIDGSGGEDIAYVVGLDDYKQVTSKNTMGDMETELVDARGNLVARLTNFEHILDVSEANRADAKAPMDTPAAVRDNGRGKPKKLSNIANRNA